MERIWLKTYPKGVPADIDADTFASLGEFMVDRTKLFGRRTALISFGGRMSHDALEEASRAFASYLQNVLKLPKGTRIAVMMPNLMQYPVVVFGALRAGCVVVNCNPLYSPRELHHQLADSGVEAIVLLENFVGVLTAAMGETSVRHVVVTGAGDLLGLVRGSLINFAARRIKRSAKPWSLPGAVWFNRALSLGRAHQLRPPEVKPTDVAFLQYTGGTTGVPKAAMLTHRNLLANLAQVNAWLAPSFEVGRETFVTALPLYHIFALTANCFTPVMIGATNLLIADPRDIPGFIRTLKRTPFSILTGVNTLFNSLLNDPRFTEIDFSGLKVSLAGGMALQRAVAQRWKATTGRPLIEAYGLTETSPAAMINPLDIEEFTGAIGLPLPSTEIAVRDFGDRDVALGESGELCIRGPQVMAGYWNKPDETAAVLSSDGFLRTGDIARVDERGYVYIVDRKKDMIIVSGFNVYPNEIEDVVMTHPGVREVGAVGVTDEKSGEAVKIVVVRKDPNVTAADLVAHCRKFLTGYKTPRHVEFRDTLPRTPIGKILRRELRETEPAKADEWAKERATQN